MRKVLAIVVFGAVMSLLGESPICHVVDFGNEEV